MASREAAASQLFEALELGDADRARLRALHVELAPRLPAIADRFYDRLAAWPGTSGLFTSAAQGAWLRATLVDWMTSGLCGPYDEQFDAKRAQIGQRHVAIGLPQHSLFAAMNLVRGEYHDFIDQRYEPSQARLVARAIDKLLDIELALLLGYYQRDAEAELLARERGAQAARVAALQTLSAGLAHEVRNPLNSATLQLELLERRLRRNSGQPQLIQPLEQVRHEIERLTRLLNEFLAFARPAELVIEDHDVAAIVREVVEAERPAAQARGAVLSDGTVAALRANVDAPKLRQIVRNLVHNAVEAVTRGGRVTVTATGDHEHVYLAIEDDGPGIPEAVQRRIYEPFFTTKDAGTGLGLSIVHGMVTLHGGTITIDSTPRGTRFDVVLPRKR
jgi:signal transduction histidine kinase